MSRTTAKPGWPRTLPRALLRGLIDDAAVFPPRSASLAAAVAGHLEHRSGPLAPFLGPLLVPASAAADLIAVLDSALEEVDENRGRLASQVRPGSGPGAAHLPAVQLISRPGQDPKVLDQARHVLAGRIQVAGVELGHSPDWRELAGEDAVAVEVPRGPAGQRALADLGRDAGGAPVHETGSEAVHGAETGSTGQATNSRIRAKLRTQSTPTDPVPTPGELAEFISTCQGLGLGFKLTGGLHHAVAGPVATPAGSEDQHGVLNVLVATHLAHAGADIGTITAALRERDGDLLAGMLLGLRADQTERVRASFTSFGCCDVGDPLQDLAGRGLLPATWPGPTPGPHRRAE